MTEPSSLPRDTFLRYVAAMKALRSKPAPKPKSLPTKFHTSAERSR
jgi:hypothetical protein